MKKMLVVLGVVAFSFGAVSCKKECMCTVTVLGVTGPETSRGEISKSDCEAFNADLGDLGKTECKLK